MAPWPAPGPRGAVLPGCRGSRRDRTAHGDRHEVNAVRQDQVAEGEAFGAGEGVASDGGEQQAERGRNQGLELGAVADGGDEQDAQQCQRGVLRRAEVQGEAGHERSEERESDDGDGAADERADGGDAQGGAGFALAGSA